MIALEMQALNALTKGIRWKLDDEPCWCACERRVAWRQGRKVHTPFCKEASAVYSALLDEAVANPFPVEPPLRAWLDKQSSENTSALYRAGLAHFGIAPVLHD